MYIFLILIFLIFYLTLAWRRLDLAVFFILATLPSYLIRFSVFGIPMTLLELMILTAFGVWFFRNSKEIFSSIKLKVKNRKLKGLNLYPFDIEIILLLIFSFIAVGVAGFSDNASGIWKAYFFEPLLFYILIINLGVNDKIFIKKIIFALSLSALAISIFAIYQKITGQFIYNEFWANPESRRVVSFFSYPNAVGLYLGPLVMLFVGFLAQKIKNFSKNKILEITYWLSAILISILAIYFAKSEGAMVGLSISLFIYILFSLFKNYQKIFYYFVYFILIFTIISPFFFLKIVPKYSYPDFGNSTINKVYDKLTLKDFSGEVRKQQWRETLMVLNKDFNWFFGVGLNNYQESIKDIHQAGIFFNFERDSDFRRKIVIFGDEYKAEHWQPLEIYMYPHNLFLNFWSELGFLGMILFIWIIGKFFYVGYVILRDVSNKSGQGMVIGLICAMVVIVVHGLVDVPYFKNDLAIIFWVLIGLLGLIRIITASAGSRLNK